MVIKTKKIVCATREIFNTWKLPSGPTDTSADILWSSVVYIENTAEIWTHGRLFGGLFSNEDDNRVSLSIGGVTKVLSLHGHTQSYTTLTGSTSVKDQAILSSGEANKWVLKTLGKNAFSNDSYLLVDGTAKAAEKVINSFIFSVKSTQVAKFDGSAEQSINLVEGDNVHFSTENGNITISADKNSDTVNTAGATNKVDTKLFIIGAQTQTASPQTYSNQYTYIGSDNCLYSLGKKVLTDHQAIYNLDIQTKVGESITKVITYDPNSANNSITLVQGSNVTLTSNADNKTITISSENTTYDFYNLIFKQGESVIDTYKPTTSPNKILKAGTNITFTGGNNEIVVSSIDTKNTAGATDKLDTKMFLIGATNQNGNIQTYTNSNVYIGTNNKLYSNGKEVSTSDHTHNYAGSSSPGGAALTIALNPNGLLSATYGSYGGILQDSSNGPSSGVWSNRIKILHNDASGYYTELAQNLTGTAGLWHRRNSGGTVTDWVPVIDKSNFKTYLDGTYVIRGNDPNVLTNYVRYSISTGLTMSWEWGNATPTHIWGTKSSDSSKAYVFNGDNIRAFANAVNKAGDTMTGTLKVTEIQATNGNGLIMWNGTTYTYLGMQAGTTYIRSGETDLQHRYNGTDYKIWDARNLVGLRTEHSHNTINFIDSRNTASTPQEHPAGVWLDFKTNANANLNDGGDYTGVLTVRKYGNTSDWTGGKTAQLGFTDNSNVWVRFGTGTAWEAWKQLSTTGWADGKFLPLAGGTMTSGARISHDGNLYIGNSNNAGWIALQDICSQNSIGDGVWSIRTNGNAIFTTIKKVGSNDSYILLGGGGQKAISQFVYADGNLGVQESTGTSDNIGRAQFWRDNSLGAYGVTLCHSSNAGYKTKIYHDYGNGGNLYMKSCSDGTWGEVHTLWNSANFNPDTKVSKAGDTMTGNLKMTETTNIILRSANTNYTSGIGYDTSGNECIALWAKNTVTRLRWFAGKDMSNMTAGSMMGITPDFEVSKASGSAVGYIGGNTIWHSGNSNLTSLAWSAKEITFGSTNFPKDAAPRANISPYSIKVWDSYGQVVAGSANYGVVLEVMGRGAHWDNQLYFEAYGHSIWHRASSYNDSSWTYTWEKLAVQSDLSKYLLLSGGTMTGALTIASSAYNRQLVIKSTGSDSAENQAGIVFTSASDGSQDLKIRGERFDSFLAGYGLVLSGGSVTKNSDPNMYLYNTGRYISKVATGTKPIDVVSTTLCTNLNADMIDGYHASGLVKFYISPMASGAPADSAKSWFTNTMPSASGAIVYNVPGSEKTIIAGKSSGSYGHMLQLNYDDNYLRILRYQAGAWKTTDWEKISAGYADNSGNASTLNGYSASSFESYKLTVIDTSSLNNNTWYPVTMDIGNSQQTRIRIEGNTAANASWNSRSDKRMSLILDYTVNGSSWGWTSAVRNIFAYQEGAGCNKCLRGLGQLTNSSTEYVYVRGGAVYNFYVSRFITPVLRTSTYTVSSQSVAPTTTTPADITRNIMYTSDKVSSATNADTATKLGSSTVGSTSKPIYLNSGSPTALSSTIGSSSKPVYLNAGTITACTGSDVLSSISSSWATNLSITVAGYTRNLSTIYADYANSLRYTKTIWGQNFNGTDNVSGNLTGVGSITMTGTISGITRIDGTTARTGDLIIKRQGSCWSQINVGGTYATNVESNISLNLKSQGTVQISAGADNNFLWITSSKVRTNKSFYSGTTQITSDIRLKNRISSLSCNMNEALKFITPFYYTKKGEGDDIRLGVSANDVRHVFPELVSELHDPMNKYCTNYYTVDYAALGAVVAINGYKELRKLVDARTRRINKLELRIAKLTRKVRDLSKIIDSYHS